MTEIRSDVPQYNTPFLDAGGNINPVWWEFFYVLLTRTGGTEGNSLEEINRKIALLIKQFDGEQAGRLARVPKPPEPILSSAAPPVAIPFRRPSSNAPAAPAMKHGQHADPGLHEPATAYANGFISATDKWHLDTLSDVGGMQLAAHRGFMTQAPQNTALAYSVALRAGADALECDVAVSSDGVYYVFHDTTVDALTDGTGTFTSLTSAYIDSLQLNFGIGTRFAPVRISRFSEYLDIANTAGMYIYPEFKRYRTTADLSGMIDAIVAAQMDRLCCLSSFSMSILQQARAYNSAIDLGFLGLSTDEAEVRGYVDQVAVLGRGVMIWDATATLAIPAVVAYARSKGVDWGVYTIDQNKDLPAMRKLGIRRIIGNTSLKVPA